MDPSRTPTGQQTARGRIRGAVEDRLLLVWVSHRLSDVGWKNNWSYGGNLATMTSTLATYFIKMTGWKLARDSLRRSLVRRFFFLKKTGECRGMGNV
jgi:hypothetical protein